MKTTILKLGTVILLLTFMGAGCEKEKDNEIGEFKEIELWKFSDFECEIYKY